MNAALVHGFARRGEPVPVVVRGERMAAAASLFMPSAQARRVATQAASVLHLARSMGLAEDAVATCESVLRRAGGDVGAAWAMARAWSLGEP